MLKEILSVLAFAILLAATLSYQKPVMALVNSNQSNVGKTAQTNNVHKTEPKRYDYRVLYNSELTTEELNKFGKLGYHVIPGNPINVVIMQKEL